MFDIKQSEVVGQTNKLLWNIWQELKAMNEPATAEQVRPDLDGFSRKELMALVKELPAKPEGWSRLSNDALKQILKEGA